MNHELLVRDPFGGRKHFSVEIHLIMADSDSQDSGEKQSQQRAYAKSLPGVDRSKAARIYIDGYYKNLLEQTEQRQKRCAHCLPGPSLAPFFLPSPPSPSYFSMTVKFISPPSFCAHKSFGHSTVTPMVGPVDLHPSPLA